MSHTNTKLAPHLIRPIFLLFRPDLKGKHARLELHAAVAMIRMIHLLPAAAISHNPNCRTASARGRKASDCVSLAASARFARPHDAPLVQCTKVYDPRSSRLAATRADPPASGSNRIASDRKTQSMRSLAATWRELISFVGVVGGASAKVKATAAPAGPNKRLAGQSKRTPSSSRKRTNAAPILAVASIETDA